MKMSMEYVRAYRERKMAEGPEWYHNYIQTIRECQRKAYAAKRAAQGVIVGTSRRGRPRKEHGDVLPRGIIAVNAPVEVAI